jgi:FkbM family methyltransferase
MTGMLKRIAARLPVGLQQSLKRSYFAYKVRRQRLDAGEREFDMLDQLVGPGDWALDVGANVGAYTTRLSRLVGGTGRVVAMEPMIETFELLCSNVRNLPDRNVTLINAAASDVVAVAGMDAPMLSTGLTNYYEARLTDSEAGPRVLCLPIDHLQLPGPVTLVKIDAEGHELRVLAGMRQLLERDRPQLIVEASSRGVHDYLQPLGYDVQHLPDSPNYLCLPSSSPAIVQKRAAG